MPFPTSSSARSGKYTDIRPIGQGAYGRVYYARDNLGREVAVKEVLPSNQEFQHFRTKFQRESQIQAAFRHPNIIHIYYLEEDPETRELYLVCEYANGGSLADHLDAHGPLSEQQAIKVALDICAALEAIWSRRIVHRDVKPSNILLTKDDQGAITEAKLGDFGIAQDQKQRATTALPGMAYPGTVLYMAPEQGNIANVLDVRADLYALGITLWEMLTKEDYKVAAQAGTPVLRNYNPVASEGVARVIQRAVQDDPAQRYPTPQAMAEELRAVLAGEARSYTGPTLPSQPAGATPPVYLVDERRPPRRQLAGALLLVVALLGAGILLIARPWAQTPSATGSGSSAAEAAARPEAQTPQAAAPLSIPANAIRLTLAYSPEKEGWLTARIAAFNAMSPKVGDRPIVAEGINKSSGAARTELRQGSFKPVVWSPSSSMWLEVLKLEADNPKVALSARSLVRTPVVISMWKPMAEALGWPNKAIGWSDLLQLINDPEGWGKYGHPEWGRFSWGHTDPEISTTALSTVLAEFYAATRKSEGLTVADVQAEASQQFLQQLAQGIKHYGYNTLIFSENMKKYGMSYISAFPMEEITLIEFNKNAPPTPLVAIYPREGTFWHDNPFIVMATATAEEQQAAEQLYNFLLTAESQRPAIEFGFRPANREVPLAAPLTAQFGVDPAQPKTLLAVPPGEVLVAAKNAWAANRKRADIVLVVDTSGSMAGDKLLQAKAGLDLFLSRLLPDDRVALITFADASQTVVPLGTLKENRTQLQGAVQNMAAAGYTALYDALLHARKVLDARADDQGRIQAVVLLSDGQNTTGSTLTLEEVKRQYGEGDIPIFPIAYGTDADKEALTAIADFTRTLLIEGSSADINQIFENMSRYF